jgi:hypothetical protein
LPTKLIFTIGHTAPLKDVSQEISVFQCISIMGFCPYISPPIWWAILWLTPTNEIGRIWQARATSDGAKSRRFQALPEIGMDSAGLEETTEDTRHERARAVAGNFRLLPANGLGRIHLRPARR